ncbi:B3 domain-containing protein Os06g0194400-like [Henckelia pumila]|uniref:B3 domain-containing protein Os06g0194400-like n=1 Tax=Henckelia pumila TaxID=405737 RepID=UPI003C6DFA29
MKKRNVLQLESREKGIAEKAKSLKYKDLHACSDDSKKSGRIVRKRTGYRDMYEDVEAMFSVMERAERVLSQLENKHPHFLKCMQMSNVSHGFWLILPKLFCSLHLPNRDSSIVLVDEWGNEYKTSYLIGRHGLSAGWRGFSVSHRLLKGDILIFHLIEPCKLKVHIVRVNGADIIGAALCLMKWNTSDGELDSAEDPAKKEKKKSRKPKYVEPFFIHSSTPSKRLKAQNEPNSAIEPAADHCGSNNDEGFSPKALEGSEICDQLQHSDLCYSKASFFKDGPCGGIACT